MVGEAVILGIESSCDDTSAAVLRGRVMLSNVIASQSVHVRYGGVIPELASRAHQQNIVPVIDAALRDAGVAPSDLDAIAFTRGPGLLGSLLVGVSFAKGFSLAGALSGGLSGVLLGEECLSGAAADPDGAVDAVDSELIAAGHRHPAGIPLVEVNHLQGHILSHFIDLPDRELPHPEFPFLCLLVSGGHSQIVVVRSPLDMEIIGTTIDDAAGEAFDKCAKVMGLPYPGGPEIDRLARTGSADRFSFARPRVAGLDYSFSGLKTSFLYFLRDSVAADPNFIENNLADLCASLQKAIVAVLMHKLAKAAKQFDIKDIAAAGGVSANSGLRDALTAEGARRGWRVFLPELRFTTDNAAMIAAAGYYQYLAGNFSSLDVAPFTRAPFAKTAQS